MRGWQLWVTPAIMLLATFFLVRAWAAGRIKERKPLIALSGFIAFALFWALVNFSVRAWEVPEVGEPINAEAFLRQRPNRRRQCGSSRDPPGNHAIRPWQQPLDDLDGRRSPYAGGRA